MAKSEVDARLESDGIKKGKWPFTALVCYFHLEVADIRLTASNQKKGFKPERGEIGMSHEMPHHWCAPEQRICTIA